MRIHYLQHVPFEGPGTIGQWATAQGHRLTCTQLYANELLPPVDDIDWLVVLGGPMNIYQEHIYPWLKPEKACIRSAIDADKVVLGICLGAQLIADVLGGVVTRSPFPEIGWFPVELTQEAQQTDLGHVLPSELIVFQWHGDMFSVPPGAVHLAQSSGCANQAFLYGTHVLGLQFHCESTPQSVALLVEHCGHEIGNGPYMQPATELLAAGQDTFLAMNAAMTRLLEWLARQ